MIHRPAGSCRAACAGAFFRSADAVADTGVPKYRFSVAAFHGRARLGAVRLAIISRTVVAFGQIGRQGKRRPMPVGLRPREVPLVERFVEAPAPHRPYQID